MLSPLMVAVFSKCSSEVGSSTTHGLRSATPSSASVVWRTTAGKEARLQVGVINLLASSGRVGVIPQTEGNLARGGRQVDGSALFDDPLALIAI